METKIIENQKALLIAVVRDRSGVLFEGEIEALTSNNEQGPFDILPFHINFISLISKSLSLHLQGGRMQQIPLESGALIFRKNKVEVYLGILSYR